MTTDHDVAECLHALALGQSPMIRAISTRLSDQAEVRCRKPICEFVVSGLTKDLYARHGAPKDQNKYFLLAVPGTPVSAPLRFKREGLDLESVMALVQA